MSQGASKTRRQDALCVLLTSREGYLNESRELEYVIAIDHHLNFSKAAEACNVSQPHFRTRSRSLSLSLACLSSHAALGSPCHPLGERVIESAKRIVLESRKIRDMATEYRDPAALPLRIGLDPTLAPYLLHYLRSAIAAQVPEMKVNIVEGEIASLADGVATRDIDIALIPGTPIRALWISPHCSMKNCFSWSPAITFWQRKTASVSMTFHSISSFD